MQFVCAVLAAADDLLGRLVYEQAEIKGDRSADAARAAVFVFRVRPAVLCQQRAYSLSLVVEKEAQPDVVGSWSNVVPSDLPVVAGDDDRWSVGVSSIGLVSIFYDAPPSVDAFRCCRTHAAFDFQGVYPSRYPCQYPLR